MVEFVDGQLFSRAEQQAVRLCGERRIPEPHQPAHPDALARQNACHGPVLAICPFKALPEVEKAAALGHGGQTGAHGGPDRHAHGCIFAQSVCI